MSMSPFEMEYTLANKGLTGNNESMLDHHGDTGHNLTGDIPLDDSGGVGYGANGTTWSRNATCLSYDFSQVHPTTALFQFLVNGLGISIVAVLGMTFSENNVGS